MSSELPPTDYFTGISFNPDFYQSSSEDYLTASTGKSYFLSYPTAQGTETITTLKSSSIDSSSTTTNMTIASAQTSGALNIVSASFTIPSTINRDYYIFCNTNASTYTITLPTRLTNQIIRIRNFSGQTLTIIAPTTSPVTRIYPAGTTSNFATTWSVFLNTTAQNFYCDGTNWLGF